MTTDQLWKEWMTEQALKAQNQQEPISAMDILLDSMIGWGLLLLSFFWLPGLVTFKLYRWLAK